jgi:hypothetical protein
MKKWAVRQTDRFGFGCDIAVESGFWNSQQMTKGMLQIVPFGLAIDVKEVEDENVSYLRSFVECCEAWM